ncbi:hypothetical protein M0811_00779 [Anaeramoeba ignava]|uniref:Uncharacterized protein n=1 Tax=Anaeramoeba ignava TaxID=1746090 RepID=A0A9Q0LIT5_ANAIG|nr:hypothetical protein M0811_00779 [Anaeramoeba ignava]
MNEIIFLEEIIKPIQFKFENQNENENEKQIKQISSGYSGTFFLFENGKLIQYLKYLDSNKNIQKIEIQIEENIQKVSADTNDRIIEDVVSGSSSIYLLTSNQNVYGIGDNYACQLGFDYITFEKIKKPILMMKNVSKIFSGSSSYSVFLLNSNQELFGCGYNYHSKLGLGESKKEETKIQKLTKIQNIPKENFIHVEIAEIKSSLFENDDNILDFSVGNAHNLILTSNSKLIGFGDNDYGQLGTGNTNIQYSPIQIELPKLRFNENIFNYHVLCRNEKSFLYYSPPSFSNLEEDLIKLFRRKEFCDISFKTKNGEIIEAHKLILKYRLNQNQNEIEKLQEIISKKSIKESNQIFEMIYSNNSKINPKLYSEIKEIINSNEKIEETMKRIYLNENENEKDFIIERKEKQYKFPKLILIMRSELYRGMFLSVTEDKSNKVTDYSELTILTKEGNAFTKGKDINPKNPNEFINISSLIEDTNDRIIEDVVSGKDTVYLLTSNQNVYGIGSNYACQLGLDSETLKRTEKPILMMKNVSKIFSGNSSEYVFLLNSNQELFGCGSNQFGQLGLGKLINEKIQKLTKIQNIPKGKIIDIQCAWSTSIMLIENENEDENPKRKLYSCGNYRYNGLGKDEDTNEFTEIKSSLFENDNILEISSGNVHTLILTSNSKLLGFGHQYSPIQIKLPKLRFNEDIFNYHISCGAWSSFLYYSPSFSNLEEDLIKLFRRKEFCDISFKTKNGEIIEAHKLILKYRLNQNQNEIEKLQEIISKKSIKESNQIFEMIYSNRIINPKLYSEIKEIINSNEKIEETMKRIYLNENENEKDFIIERKEKQYKFP